MFCRSKSVQLLNERLDNIRKPSISPKLSQSMKILNTLFTHQHSRLGNAPWLLAALLFFALRGVVQAQFGYVTNNGAITITRYNGSGDSVAIPATTNGLPVTGIGFEAFYSSSLTNVTIPNSITTSGD
jgi:hypothetical protein